MQPMQRKQTFWLIVQKNLWAMSLRSFLRYLLLACMVWVSSWAYAAEPIINGAVNTDETLLVTVQGKQATVWEISTGKKLYDVQMPEDDWSYKELKDSGRIMVATFDPKNRWFAVGGGANGIYLFDIESGALKKKLTPNVRLIEDICVSSDGNFLVDTFIGGLTIWDTTKWTYKDVLKNGRIDIPVGECTFISKEKFITASDDGELDIFDTNGENIKTKKNNQEMRDVHSMAVNVNKDKFAVSFDNGEREFLFVGDTDSLSINEIDVDDISTINFSRSLSWSRISNVLYAGGSLNGKDNSYTILNWDLKYLDKRGIINIKSGFIQKIITLKNGDIIVATAEPAWLKINKKGEIYYIKRM